MPTQAHLIVGIPVNSLADAKKALQHFGIASVTNDIGDIQEELEDGAPILSLEGQDLQVSLFMDSEACDGNYFSDLSRNKVTKQVGNSYVCLGVAITSRYSPALVDAGWEDGGRPEPFILDLPRLTQILAEAQKQWPAAQLLMMDIMH